MGLHRAVQQVLSLEDWQACIQEVFDVLVMDGTAVHTTKEAEDQQEVDCIGTRED